ncbi:MAG TPA: hypothetical protein ENN80_13555 [Candidatus Hydrogenedentes bacterium]|nr:hypothetical protein [Candidatus Hydrogenedentota bacterium]
MTVLAARRRLVSFLTAGMWLFMHCWAEPEDADMAKAPYQALDRGLLTIAMAVDDPDLYRDLPEQEDTDVLDCALDAIFGEAPPSADEEKALQILAYVPQVFGTQWSDARYGSQYLTERGGYCTGMAVAFVALCRRANLPARVVSMHNFELARGHSAAETYYEGAWHFYEPTYAMVFYTKPAYDHTGVIPSFRSLLTDKSLLDNGLRIPVPLWNENYVKPVDAIPEPLDPSFRDAPDRPPLRESYTHKFLRSFPCVGSDEMAASYPIDIDFRETSDIWLGEVDQDDMDQFGEITEGRLPRFCGIRAIGKSRFHTAFATFFVRAPRPGRCRLSIHFLHADRKHDDLGVLELRDVVLIGIESREGVWTADLYLQDAESAFIVANRSGNAYIDAIHAVFSAE